MHVDPIPDHLADKLCATIGTYARDGQPVNSSRVKDLVDIAIIASTQPISADRLRTAAAGNAAIRKIELPERFVVPGDGWARRYPKVAAEAPDGLKEVASPELLDRISQNALGLRFGDAQLAASIYDDVSRQVIAAPERWHDLDFSIALTP